MAEKAFWKHKNVFITGATGLLGSWITRQLVDQGASAIVLVRDNVPRSNLHVSGYFNKVTAVTGDLENRQVIDRVLGEYEIDTIFHVGAQTIVGIANRNPISTFESNIKGTWNILEASRQAPTVKRILVASSDKAYGEHETLPYTEDFSLRGRHPYDVSKSCADLIAQAYYATYQLPVVVTRCGNFFGGGDLNFNRLVPGTIRSVLHGASPVIRSDGKFVRDYLYIEDAASAYLTLAEQMEKKNLFGQAFNFSNEVQLSVLDVVTQIITLSGSATKPVIENTAKYEIVHQFLSAAKAHKVLGWNPAHSIEEGMKKTIAWYKNFFSISAQS